jgi:hypothetical protein
MNIWLRVALIALSVGGGFTGASMTLPFLLHPEGRSLSQVVITACFFILFGIVTASGMFFAVNQQRTRLLLISLAIQIPYIASPVVTYKFGTGFPFILIIGATERGKAALYVGFEALLGSTWRVGYGENVPWRFGVNLVAVAMIVLLWRSICRAEMALSATRSLPEN